MIVAQQISTLLQPIFKRIFVKRLRFFFFNCKSLLSVSVAPSINTHNFCRGLPIYRKLHYRFLVFLVIIMKKYEHSYLQQKISSAQNQVSRKSILSTLPPLIRVDFFADENDAIELILEDDWCLSRRDGTFDLI